MSNSFKNKSESLEAELTKANAEISRLETCFKVTAVDEATANGKLKEANERIAELEKQFLDATASQPKDV